MASNDALMKTEFDGIEPLRRGKVRDIYDLGDKLLLVVTDRVSAFDVVLPNGIPEKGKVLNQISEFWFDKTSSIVPNHIVTTDPDEYPDEFQHHKVQLMGRSMLVKKTNPLPVECIVRGYITGSGWREYQKSGAVCGITLPEGLVESEKLENPIFTPSTKAEQGEHDENITFERAAEIVGQETAERLRDLSIEIYSRARDIADKKGIIIADTKFEFGIDEDSGELILIDELLTPDSSRFWPKSDYEPGRGQKSFDKQFVRDYLSTLDWDKNAPGPELPPDVVKKTTEKYLEALERLTS